MAVHPVAAAAVLLLATPAAPAATLVWPALSGGGPCAGSLQACVDAAAAGDTVLIGADEGLLPDAYTAINETVFIRRSLTLGPAPGIDAVFAPGSSVVFQPDVPGPHQVAITGLVFRQGSVDIRDTGSAIGSVFRVERVRIDEPSPAGAGCAIGFELGSPSPQMIVGDNVVSSGGAAGQQRSGICAFASSPAVAYTANVFRNRITAGAASLNTAIALSPGNGGTIQISGNTVLGPRLGTGIRVVRAGAGTVVNAQIDNNMVAFQDLGIQFGIAVEVDNASVSVVNNTVVRGLQGLRVTGFADLPISGRVANNLVAFNANSGVFLAGGGLTNSHNLVFGNATNTFTPGPSTLTVDPQLAGPGHPRLANGSPAIDAGSNADLPALAQFDADGERRVAFGAVDIGAYEASGDGADRITAASGAVFFNETYVTPFPVPLSGSDTLVAVARHSMWPAGASALHLGVYQNPASPSGWSLFLQDVNLLMPVGAGFHVLAPFAGKTGFVHQAAAANTSGALTTIDHPALNGATNRSRIAVAFHRWQGIYHDFPIGLRWVATGGGRWQMRNEDGAAMPDTQTFNVAVAPFLSPNAFRTTLNTLAQVQWRLEHPLLDGNPCATPIVGRVDDPDEPGDIPNTTRFGVVYVSPSGPGAPGRWFVRADAPAGGGTPTFPPGAAFHVIVDGDQANRCRAPVLDAVFANGFE
ncbi:MAG: choice-of-anchor Q domain-containing protein [Pseudomonadota bacterium]|jgi:hypothetical protein